MTKYEWAVDALVEACTALNKGYVELAHEVIRAALWNAAGRCDNNNNMVAHDPVNSGSNSSTIP